MLVTSTDQPSFLADSKKLLEAGDLCSNGLYCGWVACSCRPLTHNPGKTVQGQNDLIGEAST